MGKDIKSEQIEATINENNEMGVFEHRTIREQHMYRDEILDRIKAVPLLGSSTEITVEMAVAIYVLWFAFGFKLFSSVMKSMRR